jgi:aminoglycoside phosphotransferase family enzyme
MGRRIAALALAVTLLVGAAGCSGDPDQKMLSEGARAARDAASEVSTATMAAQSLLDHKLWSQPAGQMVSDAEKSLGKVVSKFDERQPETEQSRKTYDQVSGALSDAEDNVTELRIALGNNDLSTVTKQVDQLRETGQQLHQLGEMAK